jgi:hypothetical protein
MATKLTYNLADSSQQVEASVSTDPDDISRVTIKIRATYPLPPPPATPPAAVTVNDLQRITFAVDQALTTTPDSITPEVSVFGKWGFANMGSGVFEARPNSGTTVAGGDAITFLLHDLEVAVGETDGTIKITEFPSGEVSTLTVAKVSPELRIDEFRAEPPETAANGGVTLSWATTAADTVTISGPVVPPPQKITDPTTTPPTLAPITPTNVVGGTGTISDRDKDGSLTVFPSSTAVYTLTAKGGGLIRTAQVIVTVRDHIQPVDSAGSISAASADLGTGPLTAGSALIKGLITADKLGVGGASPANVGDLAVENMITAGRLGVGTVPTSPGELAVSGGINAPNITTSAITVTDGSFSITLKGVALTIGRVGISSQGGILTLFSGDNLFVEFANDGSVTHSINTPKGFVTRNILPPLP